MKYKYKKHIATGVLAFSLLVSGSPGVVSDVGSSGFTLKIANIKTKSASSLDIRTDDSTIYSKNGINADISDLSVGQKVIVTGNLDKTANTLIAKKVKIAGNTSSSRRS